MSTFTSLANDRHKLMVSILLGYCNRVLGVFRVRKRSIKGCSDNFDVSVIDGKKFRKIF